MGLPGRAHDDPRYSPYLVPASGKAFEVLRERYYIRYGDGRGERRWRDTCERFDNKSNVKRDPGWPADGRQSSNERGQRIETGDDSPSWFVCVRY